MGPSDGHAHLVPTVVRPEPWVVDQRRGKPGRRGTEEEAWGTAGITTAVQGAGGFGKTTVAKIVRADRRVIRRFRGREH